MATTVAARGVHAISIPNITNKTFNFSQFIDLLEDNEDDVIHTFFEKVGASKEDKKNFKEMVRNYTDAEKRILLRCYTDKYNNQKTKNPTRPVFDYDTPGVSSSSYKRDPSGSSPYEGKYVVRNDSGEKIREVRNDVLEEYISKEIQDDIDRVGFDSNNSFLRIEDDFEMLYLDYVRYLHKPILTKGDEKAMGDLKKKFFDVFSEKLVMKKLNLTPYNGEDTSQDPVFPEKKPSLEKKEETSSDPSASKRRERKTLGESAPATPRHKAETPEVKPLSRKDLLSEGNAPKFNTRTGELFKSVDEKTNIDHILKHGTEDDTHINQLSTKFKMDSLSEEELKKYVQNILKNNTRHRNLKYLEEYNNFPAKISNLNIYLEQILQLTGAVKYKLYSQDASSRGEGVSRENKEYISIDWKKILEMTKEKYGVNTKAKKNTVSDKFKYTSIYTLSLFIISYAIYKYPTNKKSFTTLLIVSILIALFNTTSIGLETFTSHKISGKGKYKLLSAAKTFGFSILVSLVLSSFISTVVFGVEYHRNKDNEEILDLGIFGDMTHKQYSLSFMICSILLLTFSTSLLANAYLFPSFSNMSGEDMLNQKGVLDYLYPLTTLISLPLDMLYVFKSVRDENGRDYAILSVLSLATFGSTFLTGRTFSIRDEKDSSEVGDLYIQYALAGVAVFVSLGSGVYLSTGNKKEKVLISFLSTIGAPLLILAGYILYCKLSVIKEIEDKKEIEMSIKSVDSYTDPLFSKVDSTVAAKIVKKFSGKGNLIEKVKESYPRFFQFFQKHPWLFGVAGKLLKNYFTLLQKYKNMEAGQENIFENINKCNGVINELQEKIVLQRKEQEENFEAYEKYVKADQEILTAQEKIIAAERAISYKKRFVNGKELEEEKVEDSLKDTKEGIRISIIKGKTFDQNQKTIEQTYAEENEINIVRLKVEEKIENFYYRVSLILRNAEAEKGRDERRYNYYSKIYFAIQYAVRFFIRNLLLGLNIKGHLGNVYDVRKSGKHLYQLKGKFADGYNIIEKIEEMYNSVVSKEEEVSALSDNLPYSVRQDDIVKFKNSFFTKRFKKFVNECKISINNINDTDSQDKESLILIQVEDLIKKIFDLCDSTSQFNKFKNIRNSFIEIIKISVDENVMEWFRNANMGANEAEYIKIFGPFSLYVSAGLKCGGYEMIFPTPLMTSDSFDNFKGKLPGVWETREMVLSHLKKSDILKKDLFGINSLKDQMRRNNIELARLKGTLEILKDKKRFFENEKNAKSKDIEENKKLLKNCEKEIEEKNAIIRDYQERLLSGELKLPFNKKSIEFLQNSVEEKRKELSKLTVDYEKNERSIRNIIDSGVNMENEVVSTYKSLTLEDYFSFKHLSGKRIKRVFEKERVGYPLDTSRVYPSKRTTILENKVYEEIPAEEPDGLSDEGENFFGEDAKIVDTSFLINRNRTTGNSSKKVANTLFDSDDEEEAGVEDVRKENRKRGTSQDTTTGVNQNPPVPKEDDDSVSVNDIFFDPEESLDAAKQNPPVSEKDDDSVSVNDIFFDTKETFDIPKQNVSQNIPLKSYENTDKKEYENLRNPMKKEKYPKKSYQVLVEEFEKNVKKYTPLQIDESEAGIPNVGNSCYINATIQLLRKIPDFRALIFNMAQDRLDDYKLSIKNLMILSLNILLNNNEAASKHPSIAASFKTLFFVMIYQRRKNIFATKITEMVNGKKETKTVRGLECFDLENDAEEFMLCLFEFIIENDREIKNIIGAKRYDVSVCNICKNPSNDKNSEDYDFDIQIPAENKKDQTMRALLDKATSMVQTTGPVIQCDYCTSQEKKQKSRNNHLMEYQTSKDVYLTPHTLYTVIDTKKSPYIIIKLIKQGNDEKKYDISVKNINRISVKNLQNNPEEFVLESVITHSGDSKGGHYINIGLTGTSKTKFDDRRVDELLPDESEKLTNSESREREKKKIEEASKGDIFLYKRNQ